MLLDIFDQLFKLFIETSSQIFTKLSQFASLHSFWGFQMIREEIL